MKQMKVSLDLFVLGDICLSNYRLESYKQLLSEMQSIMVQASYRVANFECTVIDNEDGVRSIKKTGPNLKVSSNQLEFLKVADIDIAVLANNHVGDYGEEGVINTINELETRDILHVGAGRDIDEAYAPIYLNKNDMSVSLIAVCENEFGVAKENKAGVAGYIGSRLISLIAKEKAAGYKVVVIFHGGNEYNPLPSPGAQKRYRELIDAGAVAVIAMHTHCPQGYEYYRGAPIVYSLGNFFFPYGDAKKSQYDSWNRGYAVKLSIYDESSELEIFPYCNDVQSNTIKLLKGRNKEYFLKYIDTLNSIIGQEEVLKEYFYAWSLHSGKQYATHLKSDIHNSADRIKEALEAQNLFRCEAHRELMQRYFELLTFDDIERYEAKWVELKKMSFIPYENKYGKMVNQMFLIDNEMELLNLAQSEKRVLIYGAGKIAQALMRYLPANGRYVIEGILVSDDKQNAKSVNGIDVYGIQSAIFDKDTMVLVGVGKPFQKEVCDTLEQHGYTNIAILAGGFEARLNGDASEIGISDDVEKRIIERTEALIEKITPRTRLKTLVVNICDHCNLNCQCCDHFSPLAEPRIIDKEVVERDIKRMHELLGENMDRIAIMGGEPLLHPDVNEILVSARRIFKKADIWLSTNGLLLNNRSEEFWNVCSDNNITLSVTKYPVNFDYDAVKNKAESRNVKFFYTDGGETVKTSYHIPLDVKGAQDSTQSFINCFHANNRCNMLSEGKLWTCTVAPNMWIFAKKFNVEMSMTEYDGIDIYSVRDAGELFERLAKPMPACRFCNVKERSFGHQWKQSERKKSEWT